MKELDKTSIGYCKTFVVTVILEETGSIERFRAISNHGWRDEPSY